ncbi:hypothetical protein BKA69DRAFT_1109968 [Paraphysoderma sedebokerense]|nr:hypothetical protein BKA69DRAFT_1109968 [Paraphysoderma sedebokerense]
MGNTCYFNSIVQCLNGTLPLSRYFLSSFKKHINRENPLGTKGALAVAFAELIRTLWSSSQDTFVVPIKFRDAIGTLHTQFSTSDQQDSQEFLAFLLDGLHEDLKLPPASSTPPPEIPDEEFEKLPAHIAAEEAWKRYMFKNSSFVVQLFMGQLRSRLSCLTCGKTSTSYNPFMYLSIPVIKGNRVDLGDCLDEFLREEILEGSDAWHCSNCRTTRRSTKSLTLSKLPDILLIHLKRFSFQGPFRNKLDTLVDFPVKGLDLNLYLGYPEKTGPWIYDLYAVSNHFGGLDGGHCTL